MAELANQFEYRKPKFSDPQNRTYVSDNTVVRGIFGVQKTSEFPEVAAFGFNVVQAYGSIDDSLDGDEKENEYLERMRKYLDKAKNNQLQVLHTIPGTYTRNFAKYGNDAFINFVNEFKNHSALYAWYFYDEPNENKISVEELQTAYQKLKELDPNHLVFTSTWEPGIAKKYASGYDVMLPQLYDGEGAIGMNNKHFEAYDLTIMEGAHKPWIGMINTHDSQLVNTKKKIHLSSPSGWNGLISEQGDFPEKEAERKMAEVYLDERLKELNNNLSNPFRPELKVDDTYIPDHIRTQLMAEISRVTDEENPEPGRFYNSGTFPISEEMLLGEVLLNFCYGSNGIFSWIWQSPSNELTKFNRYTIFQYEHTKDAIKPINDLIKEISFYLDQPETDYVHIQGPLIMRFFEKNNRRLILVVKQSEGDIDKYSLEFPVEWGLSYSDQFLDLYTKKQIRFGNKILEMGDNTGLALEGPLPEVAPISTMESIITPGGDDSTPLPGDDSSILSSGD